VQVSIRLFAGLRERAGTGARGLELPDGATADPAPRTLHVIARDQSVPITRVGLTVTGTVDRGNQPRTDVTLFNTVRLRFTVGGTDAAQAAALVEGFKRR